MTEELRLVDCSNNNPQPIDWKALKKAGAAGGIYKASEGTTFKDPTFDVNWQAIKAAELVRGCYAFALPASNNPLAEADLFLRVVGHLEDYDIPALDIESGGGPGVDLSAWALAWLQDVESALRTPPLLYANLNYVLNYLKDPRLARYPLWLAAYGPTCPPRAGVWDTVTLWQHADSASWPGIQGNVDESLIARDLAGLKKLGKQPVMPPTPPAPPNAKRYVVLVEMRCRPVPQDDSSFSPPQYAHVGAVLNGTGKVSGPWVQVVAGGRPVWLLGANLKAL